MSILKLIAKENYITYSKPLAKRVGVDEAILFGELCSLYNYFDEQEFFCEQERLIEDTCLTEYRVRNATKNLAKLGLIKVTKKGLPAKNYYELNEKNFLEVIESRTTSGCKFDTTGDSKIDTTINNNRLKKIDNNIKKELSKDNSKESEPSKAKKKKVYIDVEKIESSELFLSYNFSDKVNKAIVDWLTYKNERKDTYTEIGIKKFLTHISNSLDLYDEKYVVRIINLSIERQWVGIRWNILEEKAPKKQNITERNEEAYEDEYGIHI